MAVFQVPALLKVVKSFSEACKELGVDLGGIAQLGERLHGMQEVSSSILLTSTKI